MKISKKIILAIMVLLVGISIFLVAPIHYVSAEPQDRTIEVEYESIPEKDSYSKPSEWVDENLKIVDAESLKMEVSELHKMSILGGDGRFDFSAGMKIFWLVEDSESYVGEEINITEDGEFKEELHGFPAGRDIRDDVLREDWYPSYWVGTLTWAPENARVVDEPYGTPEKGPHELVITLPPGKYIAWVGLREDTKFIRFTLVAKESS